MAVAFIPAISAQHSSAFCDELGLMEMMLPDLEAPPGRSALAQRGVRLGGKEIWGGFFTNWWDFEWLPLKWVLWNVLFWRLLRSRPRGLWKRAPVWIPAWRHKFTSPSSAAQAGALSYIKASQGVTLIPRAEQGVYFPFMAKWQSLI